MELFNYQNDYGKIGLRFGNLFKKLSLKVFVFSLLLLVQQSNAQVITSNIQSVHDGFFYSFWNDATSGTASMTLGAGGHYSTAWSGVGNFTAGKGWATGKEDRVVHFSGSFDGGGNGFLALYGWTKDSLVEYYVVENHGDWTPPGGVSKGTFTSDDGTYNIYETTRTNQPSIIGTATFQQYWSVRTTKRSSGTVTFANHVAAWKSKGMKLGKIWDYQIIETEGYHSNGSSDITVSEGPIMSGRQMDDPTKRDTIRSIGAYFTPATKAKKAQDAEGFIQRWTLLEPINKPNRGNSGFTDSYLRKAFDTLYFQNQFTILPKDGEKVKVADKELTWHALDSKNYNVKLFRFAYGLNKQVYGVLFWAVTVVNCPREMKNVRMAVGSNSASMWWLNGKEALLLSGDRRMVADDCVSSRLTLNKGRNIIRGAVINGPGMSDFCVRFLDEKGEPIKDLTISCE